MNKSLTLFVEFSTRNHIAGIDLSDLCFYLAHPPRRDLLDKQLVVLLLRLCLGLAPLGISIMRARLSVYRIWVAIWWQFGSQWHVPPVICKWQIEIRHPCWAVCFEDLARIRRRFYYRGLPCFAGCWLWHMYRKVGIADETLAVSNTSSNPRHILHMQFIAVEE